MEQVKSAGRQVPAWWAGRCGGGGEQRLDLWEETTGSRWGRACRCSVDMFFKF